MRNGIFVVRVDLETNETNHQGPLGSAQDSVFEWLTGEGFRHTTTVVTPDGRYAVVTLTRDPNE